MTNDIAATPPVDTRWKPSVTVAAIIHRESDGRFLLVEERTQEGLKLNNPAGHLDLGESPLEGCVREVLEETGCVFTPEALVGMYVSRFQREATGEDITYLRFAFCGTVGEPLAGRVLDEPIERTLWMTPDEIRAALPRHRSRMVLHGGLEDFLSGIRYPLQTVTTDASVYGLLYK